MMDPARFLTILKYTTEAGGKREIARMILWSNDLVLDLAGDDFANQQHAAAFLWWAKDQLGGRPAA
ncbi:hypothetical protein AB0G29_15320 [Streptomyces parvus]|uniref:hypothetical protein n=1 Tax=Streptomyces TaxID=1883 RepID=UPI0033DECDD2